MSEYPLLHPGLTPVQDWLDQRASLDSDEWVSTPPSWSDSLHHYWSDQGHVWTQMSGYPPLHPGLTPAQDWLDQGACLDSEEWVSTPPPWSNGLHHYWSDQGACLDSDVWVSTPPSWSDPCPGLVGLGGIFGLRRVGVHSSILVRQLAPLLVGPGAWLDSDLWVSTPPTCSAPCRGLVGLGGIFGLRRVGVHSSILVQRLAPLLVGPGAWLDSDVWVSTPPSWSDPCPGPVRPGGIFGLRRAGVHSSILVRPLPRTSRTRGHLWTQKSGCPLLHPGPTACITTSQTRGMFELRVWRCVIV